jgi:hypothetical protein
MKYKISMNFGVREIFLEKEKHHTYENYDYGERKSEIIKFRLHIFLPSLCV